MRCEVGAFVMSKRRKMRAMRRGKERGAAPKMSGRLGSPGRRIRKEGNYGQKAAVFCEKVLHFCAKVPLFSTRSAHPSAGGARFCAGSRASFERRACPIFWGIREKGRTCALFAACCMTNGRLPLPRNCPLLSPFGGACPKKSGRLVARSAEKVELLYRLPSRRIVKGRALARNSPKSCVE